jgi:hypothetical protein
MRFTTIFNSAAGHFLISAFTRRISLFTGNAFWFRIGNRMMTPPSVVLRLMSRTTMWLVLVALMTSCVCLGRNEDEPLVIVQGGKYGYIDHAGRVIIQPQFIWAEDFWRGLGTVYVCGRYVSIDSSGVLLPLRVTIEGHLEPRHEGEKVGFVDASGQFKISPDFDDALPFSEGLAAVQVGGKWGFVDATGQLVIRPQFKTAFYFREGVGTAQLDSDYVLIDRSGKVLASGLQFVDLVFDGRVPAARGGKNGYLDLRGNVAIPFIYEAGSRFSSGLAAVKKDGKWGYADTDGRLTIRFEFDEAGEFASGLAPVRIGGRTGFINTSGKFKFNLPFHYAPGFFTGENDSNLFIAETDVSRFWTDDNKFGYVNTSGKVIWGPTDGSPGHPPLLGWSEEDNKRSCEGIPESIRTKIAQFPY